ncbi:MAG: gliding motility-associated C-terminal domain-containing protein [Ilyomonas sp.]
MPISGKLYSQPCDIYYFDGDYTFTDVNKLESLSLFPTGEIVIGSQSPNTGFTITTLKKDGTVLWAKPLSGFVSFVNYSSKALIDNNGLLLAAHNNGFFSWFDINGIQLSIRKINVPGNSAFKDIAILSNGDKVILYKVDDHWLLMRTSADLSFPIWQRFIYNYAGELSLFYDNDKLILAGDGVVSQFDAVSRPTIFVFDAAYGNLQTKKIYTVSQKGSMSFKKVYKYNGGYIATGEYEIAPTDGGKYFYARLDANFNIISSQRFPGYSSPSTLALLPQQDGSIYGSAGDRKGTILFHITTGDVIDWSKTEPHNHAYPSMMTQDATGIYIGGGTWPDNGKIISLIKCDFSGNINTDVQCTAINTTIKQQLTPFKLKLDNPEWDDYPTSVAQLGPGFLNPGRAFVQPKINCFKQTTCDKLQLIGDQNVCKDGTYTFIGRKNEGCPLPLSWNILSDPRITSTIMNDSTVSVKFTDTGTFKIKASFTSSCDNQFSDSIDVHVSGSGSLNLGNDTSICSGDSLLLRAGPGFESYLWNDGSTDSILMVKTPGTYSVAVKNSCGETLKDDIKISSVTPAKFDFSKDTSKCLNDTLVLSVPASLTITSTNPTENILQQENNLLFYNKTATKFFIEAKDNNSSCTVKDSVSINIFQQPVVDIGPPDTSVCSNAPVTLDAGAGFEQYLWSSGEATQTIEVSQPATYFVTVKDNNGCHASDTIIVKSNSGLQPIFLGNDTTICAGDSLLLNAGDNSLSYEWQDGSTASTYWVKSPGKYFVKVTNNGCFVTDTITVAMYTATVIDLGKDTSFCSGNSLTLDAGTGFTNYLWSTGETTQQIEASTPGIYSVSAKDANGCTAKDTLIIKDVFAAPTLALGNDITICAGDSLLLNAGNGFKSYLWNDGSADSILSVSTPGEYVVQVTNYCNDVIRDTIIVSNYTKADFNLPADTTKCLYDTLILSVPSSFTNINYTPSENALLQQNNLYLFNKTSAQFILNANDNNGCNAADTVLVNIKQQAVIDLGADTSFCSGNSITLDAGAGFTNYVWNTGETTQQIEISTPGTYSVNAKDVGGCIAKDTLIVKDVIAVPSLELGNDTTICAGDSLLLNAGDGFKKYLWQDGSTDSTLKIKSPGLYHVQVSNYCGGTVADSIQINVLSANSFNFPTDTSKCLYDTLILNVPSSLTAISYTPSENVLMQQNSLYFFNNSAEQFILNAKDNNGCNVRDTVIMNIAKQSTINLGPDTSLCAGSSVLLNAGNGFTNYVWSTGETTQQINVSSAGTYIIKALDPNGCTAKDTFVVKNVIAIPTLYLGNDTTICAVDSLLLKTVAQYDSYEWQDESTNPQFLVTTAGKYFLKASANGCSISDTININTFEPAVIDLGADTSLCTGTSITLDAGSGFVDYAWNNGETTQQIQVSSPGTYTIKATNANGCAAKDTLIVKDVLGVPTLELGNDTTICEGDSLLLNASDNYKSYVWQDNSTDSVLWVTKAGSYSVKVENYCGGFVSDNINIKTLQPDNFNFPADTLKCVFDTLVLKAPSSFSGLSFVPAENISIQQNSFQFSNATPIAFILKGIDTKGCKVTDTILVNLIQTPQVDLGADTAVCMNSNITVDAGSGFTNYVWNTGETAQQIVIKDSGSYTVKAYSTNGCYSADTINVSVHPPVNLNFSNDSLICKGSSYAINPGTFKKYLWQDGSTAPEYILKQPGQYWVQVTDNYNCVSRDTLTIKGYKKMPENFLPDTLGICKGNVTNLQSNQSFASYFWNTGSTSPVIQITEAGLYWLKVTNTEGCSNTDSVSVYYKNCVVPDVVYFPTAFTPNHDGLNDLYKASVSGNLQKFHLAIFNRFGQKVFESSDPQRAWDGTIAGLDQQAGVYVFMGSYQFNNNNKTETIKGTITLIR